MAEPGMCYTSNYDIQDSETAGMIPRAVEQVFRVAEQLRAKGWEYRMEGQFLEIVSSKSLLTTDKSLSYP